MNINENEAMQMLGYLGRDGHYTITGLQGSVTNVNFDLDRQAQVCLEGQDRDGRPFKEWYSARRFMPKGGKVPPKV